MCTPQDSYGAPRTTCRSQFSPMWVAENSGCQGGRQAPLLLRHLSCSMLLLLFLIPSMAALRQPPFHVKIPSETNCRTPSLYQPSSSPFTPNLSLHSVVSPSDASQTPPSSSAPLVASCLSTRSLPSRIGAGRTFIPRPSNSCNLTFACEISSSNFSLPQWKRFQGW